MSNNQPDFWIQFLEFLRSRWQESSAIYCAASVGFCAALLRSFLYGKKDSPRRITAESALCSLIIYSAHPIFVYFNLSTELMIPLGTAMGLFGTSMIRQLLIKYVTRKIEIMQPDNSSYSPYSQGYNDSYSSDPKKREDNHYE